MTEKNEPRIVGLPSDEAMEVAFEAYALALGKVIYTWNFLLETLGQLFIVVVGDADREILSQIWNVPDSDRVRVEMLEAAAKASKIDRWMPRLPTVRDDVLWLTHEATSLIDARNDAAHGLVSLFIDADRSVIAAHPATKHKRAARLRKRGDLLVEFERLELWGQGLTGFTLDAESALHPSGTYPWPDRPRRPTLQPKTVRPDQPPLADT